MSLRFSAPCALADLATYSKKTKYFSLGKHNVSWACVALRYGPPCRSSRYVSMCFWLTCVSMLFQRQRKSHNVHVRPPSFFPCHQQGHLPRTLYLVSFNNAPLLLRPSVPSSRNHTGATLWPGAWCCWSRTGRPPLQAENRVYRAAVYKAAAGEGTCEPLEEQRPRANCGPQ